RRAPQRAAVERLGAAGYEEIIPPTFEYAEVFVRAAGAADVADRLIRFFDLDGKLLALRYDFTASVARLAATKLADRPTPLRLCYSGAVFRQDPERANGGGRPREILQVGAELLGDAAIAADVEVLRLALELVRRASPQEYQVNLGHVGALAPALDALPPEQRTRVRRLIDRKDAAGLATAAPGSLTELPFIIGRREALDRAQRVAPDARAAIDRLREIDAALADEERRHVVYDFGEVRGLDYYTGMHFEIFVTGAGSAVGAGGRYDDLIGRFGRPLPAVGLALDLESGAADLGITGTDVLRETEADVLEPLALGFGACRMVVASPTHVPYPSLPGGVTPRVATKYPRLTRVFFAETGLGVEVITV